MVAMVATVATVAMVAMVATVARSPETVHARDRWGGLFLEV